MDLWQHLRIIWRHKYRIGFLSLLIAAAAFTLSDRQAEVYSGATTLSVVPGRMSAGDIVSGEQLSRLVRSYGELATSRTVLDGAIERAGLAISSTLAESRVSIDPAEDTGFFDVVATGPSPEDAAVLAAAVADELIDTVASQQTEAAGSDTEALREQVEELEVELAGLPEGSPAIGPLTARYTTLLEAIAERELRPTDRIDIITPARAYTTPISPTPLRDALVALVVALVVNAELSVALAHFGGRFTSRDLSEEFAATAGVPVLARVPAREGPQLTEAYRTLRTNVLFSNATEGLRSLAIVGANPGSGKSFTSVRLAKSIAAGGTKVLLVDADLRRPTLHRILNLDNRRGFADAQEGESFSSLPISVPLVDNLWLLTAGRIPADPAATIGARLSRILDEVPWADMVIFDTPAAALFTDAAAVAAECDGTLVVVDAGSSRRSLRSTIASLEQVHARVLGVIANRMAVTERRSYYERYTAEDRS